MNPEEDKGSYESITLADGSTTTVFLPPRFENSNPNPLFKNAPRERRRFNFWLEPIDDRGNPHFVIELSPTADPGLTTLAFIYGGGKGIMVAVHHNGYFPWWSDSHIVPRDNAVDLNSHIGTVSGVLLPDFLRRLKLMCLNYEEKKKGKRASVSNVSQWMVDHLRSEKKVKPSLFCGAGLVAGWGEKGPELYRVDSEGVQLKGEMLATGLFPHAYADAETLGYRQDMSFHEAQKLAIEAIRRTAYSLHYNAPFASVYHVGPDGLRTLHDMVPVEDFNRNTGQYFPQ
ncbi:OLC1v1001705C1 [Oldenlandia corymbosa var. corymbosa]|uniref:OLC1v1001705C1 n=1 Tax=Oldenlandia corymbosa var. corymbosa TaxID=529605 RepID=A0AAV1D8E7_OLDCO|nr:OLC1v1001705C1 [Oldenlandia corymbosa var. corymbosa]